MERDPLTRAQLAILQRAAEILDDCGREILGEQVHYAHDEELGRVQQAEAAEPGTTIGYFRDTLDGSSAPTLSAGPGA